MLFSIVTPWFNASHNINTYFEHMYNQGLSDDEFELVIIDDGSTDDSFKRLSDISKEHKNLKLIHQENSGCVAARLKGFDEASGDFILSCDADDYFFENALSKLKKIIISNSGIDAIKFPFLTFFNSERSNLSLKSFEHQNPCNDYNIFSKDILNSAIDKCIKSSLIKSNLKKVQELSKNIKLNYHEDVFLMLLLTSGIRNLYYFVDEPLYFYDKTNYKSLVHSMEANVDNYIINDHFAFLVFNSNLEKDMYLPYLEPILFNHFKYSVLFILRSRKKTKEKKNKLDYIYNSKLYKEFLKNKLADTYKSESRRNIFFIKTFSKRFYCLAILISKFLRPEC